MRHIPVLALGCLLWIVSCEEEVSVAEEAGELPVIRLSVTEEHLWSPDSGLYVIGHNGITFGCGPVANYNQKWEYPVTIEYTEPDGTGFVEHAGFRIKGTCSRNHPMKSFGLYWRREYGNSELEYPLFPGITTTTFKRLLLRNSGNDFGRTHIKDASISSIFRGMAKVDYQEYKPCVLYLNDAYWGIYNIREMITPHHFGNHYGVDDDQVDLLEGCELNPVADDGSKEDFMNDVIGFIQSNDPGIAEHYLELANRMDIDSYMDYVIINTYILNTDWPCSNAKWWRDKTSEYYSKWRWVIYDTDLAFKDLKNVDDVWIGDLYGVPYSEWKEEGFFIFNQLIRNDAFKEAFLNRYLYFIEHVFEKERVRNIITGNRQRIEPEYANHRKKWNTLPENEWKKEIDRMIEFNNRRNDRMKKIILELQNEAS